jgi:chromosome partitioning protein
VGAPFDYLRGNVITSSLPWIFERIICNDYKVLWTMAKIICIANQKGGVGKTTTTINLAAALSLLGKRTLIVDFDPQGNASSGLGIDVEDRETNIYHVVIGQASIESVIQNTEVKKLRILPSNRDLIGAEVELLEMDDRTTRLKDVIETVRDQFDYIFIDCPPSLGQLTINALVSADSVLVALQSEYYALEGLSELLNTIELVRKELNPDLDLEGIVLTMFDGRNNLSRQVDEEIREHFGQMAFETRIPRNVRLSEAPSFGQPVMLYDVRCAGSLAYLALGREFLKRNNGPAPDAATEKTESPEPARLSEDESNPVKP